VVVLVRDSAPESAVVRDGWMRSLAAVYGSISDADLLRRVMAEYSVQTVFHLAAQTQVGVAKVDPVGTLEANVRGTWNVLEAARGCGGVQVVVASSDKAYGASGQLPYTEEHPLRGTYPYDVSKSCMDLISSMYATSFSLPVAIARCANLFGGGDLNFARVIPGVIRASLRGERFVIRSDGKYVRDYLYVEDAVEGYLKLAERLAQEPALAGEAFNFSAKESRTVLEVVHAVLQLFGRTDLEPIILNQASNEIREQTLCSDKARRVLDWAPQFDFPEALKRTIEWYRTYIAGSGDSQEAPARVAASSTV
jgi:CDP-glucose 4,6-dehydratase